MKFVLKIARVAGLYIGCVCIIAIVLGCVFGGIPESLNNGISSYRFANGWKFFFSVFPAIQLGSITLSCAFVFGRECKTNLPRFSSTMLNNLGAVMLVGGVLTCFSFMCHEIGVPLVTRYQQHKIERSEKYKEYYNLAQKYSDEQQFPLALFYIEHALLQNPKSEEGLSLRDKIELHTSEYTIYADTPDREAVNAGATDLTSSLTNGYTVTQLMEKARKGYDSGNYFDAHYYATLAVMIAPSTDGNIQAARLLASDAWNKLSSSSDMFSYSDEELLFNRKREGYTALLNGNWLHAYYVFHDLEKEHSKDPDVIRYGTVAKEKLNNDYFFIDETFDLRAFENAINVYFVVPHPTGGHDVVSIRGITSVENAGGLVQYLRGLTIYSYNENGSFKKSFSVPYAKMYAQKTADFDSSLNTELGKLDDVESIPYIILESVDRDFESIVNKPEYVFADDELEEYSNKYILPMSYDDIPLIIDASLGADSMPLFSLVKFIYIAHKYGYSAEVFGQSLVTRICFPLLLMILSLVAGIIGWNYRLAKKQVFKFVWIIVIPILTALSYILFEIISSFQVLFDFALVGGFHFTALLVAIILYVLILAGVSIVFLAQRGE